MSAQPITLQDIADKLGFERKPLTGYGSDLLTDLRVDGEDVRVEIYLPYSRGYWSNPSTPQWDRVEIRVNGQRFRRSKARNNDFDWDGVNGIAVNVKRNAENIKFCRDREATRSAHRKANTQSAAELLNRYDIPAYQLRPSDSQDGYITLSIGTHHVTAEQAETICSILFARKA
jgi:hypothetical protein